MLQIAFIGALNQTNSIISEILNIHFDLEIEFISPPVFFTQAEIKAEKGRDLVFVDIDTSSGLGNAPQKVKLIKKAFPDTPVLVLQAYEHQRFSKPLVQAGANGILPITPNEDELVAAVKQVLAGKMYRGPEAE